MPSLPERIEAAEGPSRELDAEIYWKVKGFPAAKYSRAMGVRARGSAQPSEMEWLVASSIPPPYTASIDAAMTLVPEGRFFALGPDSIGGKKWVAAIFLEGSSTWTVEDSESEAATPALALCAAALKARAKEQPNEG